MKKIILLFSILLFLGGCSDYKEVNEMAIISGIGIDYDDGNFIVTLETFNNKVDGESSQVKTYTRNGIGKSVAVALEKAADELSMRAYYSHVKLCVLSENVAKFHFQEIVDFFIRSTYLRENFNVIVSKIKPSILLDTESKENPIASTALNMLLETNAYASNYALETKFDIFVSKILNFGIDGAMSVINLEDNNFYIDGLAIFKDYKMVNILDNDDAVIFNLLTNNIKKPVFNLEYGGKSFTVAIYDSSSNIKVDTKNILVTGNYKAKIMDNDANFDIKNTDTLKDLNTELSNHLNKLITDFIKKLQENESDILGLANNFYVNNRTKTDKLWIHTPIKSNTEVVINKKGLVYNLYETNR